MGPPADILIMYLSGLLNSDLEAMRTQKACSLIDIQDGNFEISIAYIVGDKWFEGGGVRRNRMVSHLNFSRTSHKCTLRLWPR